MSNPIWGFSFDGATTEGSAQPSATPPHKFVTLAGIDGRFDGVLRRYPGHIRYPDSGARSVEADYTNPDIVDTALTQSLVEAPELRPDIVREFQVARGPAKRELIRGLLVASRATGQTELWFRLADDATGRLRRQKLRAPLSRYLELEGTTTIRNMGDAVAFGKLSTYGNPSMTSEPGEHLLDFGSVECLATWGTEELGTHLYAGGVFRRAGGRNCNFVARFDGVAWEPVGFGFDGPVYSLLAFGPHLYAAGEFRRTGDGTRCRGFARWDGVAWIEVGGGIDPSDMDTNAFGTIERTRVWSMCAWPLSSPTHIFLAGEFKGVDNEAPVLSRNIAGWNPDTEAWDYTFGGDFDHVTSTNRTAILGICSTTVGGGNRLCIVGRFGPASGGAPDEGVSPADNDGATASVASIKRVALIAPDLGLAHTYTDLLTDFAGDRFLEVDQGFPWTCVQFDPGGGAQLFVGGMQSEAARRGAIQSWDGAAWNESGFVPRGTVFKLRVANGFLWALGCFSQAWDAPGSATPVEADGILRWPSNPVTGITQPSESTLPALHYRTANQGQALAAASSPTAAPNFHDILYYTDAQGTSRYSLGASYYTHVAGQTFMPRGNAQLSTATFGRYLYVFSSTGAHKTLWWDEESERFKMDDYGPHLVDLPRPTAAVVAGGRQLWGRYSSAFRYWDSDRLRVTGLSLPSTDIQHTEVNLSHRVAPRAHLFMYQPCPGSPQTNASAAAMHTCAAPDSYSRVILYETQSSAGPDIPAGGRLYLAHRGSVYPNDETTATDFNLSRAPGSWKILSAQDESWDTGNGESAHSLSDLALVAQPSWDILEDFPGEAARVYAASHYQGTTFVLEADQEFMVLKWGPLSLLRPEEINPTNTYQTRIKVSDALSCGLHQAGDYLFLHGGTELYRIQKAGANMSVVRIADNLSFVHGDAATRLDNYLAVATKTDLLIVEPGTGRIKPLFEASRIFLERWRGSLEPSSDLTLRMAYDSEMECLYVHHRLIDETLCYWLRRNKVTILPYNFYDTVVTCEDLEGGLSRAYFVSARRWLATPNHAINSGTAQTMAGDFLHSAATLRYNPEILTVSTDPLPAWIPDIGGNTVTTLSWAPATPFEAETADGPKALGEFAILFLTGAHAGRAFRVPYNTSDTLYLASELDPIPEADDIIALAPVVFYAMGAPLWDPPKSSWNPFSRKVVVAMGAASSNVYAGDGGDAYALGSAKFLQYQTARPQGIQEHEPRTAIGSEAQYDLYGATGGIPALDTDKTSRNWGSIRVDGNLLFPIIRCDVSDTAFDLHAWVIAGDVRDAGISGPGTGSTPSA